MQTWDDIRLDLLTVGFREIHFIEIECAEHGAFRAGVEEMLDTFACPRCGRSAAAGYLGRALTRNQAIPWECVSNPLSTRCKGEDQDSVARIQRHRPRHWRPLPGRPAEPESEARAILYAFLRLLGVPQKGMRSQLFPESDARKAKNSTTSFYSRHRDAIAEAEKYLASLPLSERRTIAECARSQLAKPVGNPAVSYPTPGDLVPAVTAL